MVLTITIPDEVAEQLQRRAVEQQRTVEELAAELLDAVLADRYIPLTLEEIAAKARSLPRNPNAIRPAEGSLLEYLRNAPDDPDFDLEAWEQEWAKIEAEIEALGR